MPRGWNFYATTEWVSQRPHRRSVAIAAGAQGDDHDRGALCVSTGKLKVREGSDHEYFFLGPHTGPLKIVSVSGNVVTFRSRLRIGHFNFNYNVLRFLP